MGNLLGVHLDSRGVLVPKRNGHQRIRRKRNHRDLMVGGLLVYAKA